MSERVVRLQVDKIGDAFGRYPLPEGASRAFSQARYWADELLDRGIPQEYGLGPPRPVTAAEGRDFETLMRVTGRIFDREEEKP